MDYSYQLWTTNRGVQMPKILHEAPAYIMEELMGAAYGKHLAEVVSIYLHKLRFLTLLILFLEFRFLPMPQRLPPTTNGQIESLHLLHC